MNFVVERRQLFTWAVACPLCNDLDRICCMRACTHTHVRAQQ